LVREAVGSIFRRKDGKYFVYLPQAVAEDTSFPFEIHSSIKVTVKFTGEGKIVIESLSK